MQSPIALVATLIIGVAATTTSHAAPPAPAATAPRAVTPAGAAAAEAPDATRAAQQALLEEVGLLGGLAERVRAEGVGLERLMAQTPDFDEVPAAGVVVVTAPGDGRARLVALRRLLPGSGFRAYLKEERFGSGPDRVAVARVADDAAYLAIVRTDGVNHGLEHEDVMRLYAAWDARLGLRLDGAGLDFIEARITRPPADWNALAAEVHAACPDLVDQGLGSVEALAEDMRRHQTLSLWWD
jgi:hypothetical protein